MIWYLFAGLVFAFVLAMIGWRLYRAHKKD